MSNEKSAKRPSHRPKEMEGGKRRNVYIDDASWEIARQLGGEKRNASEGIRYALALASEQQAD
ncbi:hypothetical protein [Marinobacter sp. X15-166B]|uniref:hypothetical protein n=1 Tax=Marinobacter sp. X15-166B TaxID=1897620 RepID=UPI00085C18DD|nr:hypothetical protein [Marinobacter sp. X15-166B]OEY66789.1 hypothetical protein BG841_10210 [Marinobacter sp. X15-166B]